jgi:hypothetical protein
MSSVFKQKKGVTLYSRPPPGNMLQMNGVQSFLIHEPGALFTVITAIADIRHFVIPLWFEPDLIRSQLLDKGIKTSLGIWRELMKSGQFITWLLITNRTILKIFLPAAFSNVAGFTIRDQFSAF